MVDKLKMCENLEKLGLNTSEVDVYYELLNNDKISVMQLSKKLGVPRTTLYRICESLVKRGFATWIITNNGKDIKPVSPKSLDFLIEEEKAKLKEIDSSVKNLQEMSQQILHNVPKTEIKYFQGRDGMRQIIWNTLKAENEIFGYSEFGRVAIVGNDFYDSYVKEFKLKQLKDRAITNDSEETAKYMKQFIFPKSHQLTVEGIRFISKDIFYVSGDHSIYNNTYAICYWNQGEIVGVEIENPEIVKLHRCIFELLWGLAKPIAL
jgi:sugar-specific transcriptional regulator TrmB